MRINATAYLYYSQGESIASGWEGLYLYVKFKEEGKLFKTKLEKRLTSTYFVVNSHLVDEEYRYETFDDYYNHVEQIIKDEDSIKEWAVEMIKKYFNENHKDLVKENKKKEISRMVNDSGKIEITVEIK